MFYPFDLKTQNSGFWSFDHTVIYVNRESADNAAAMWENHDTHVKEEAKHRAVSATKTI